MEEVWGCGRWEEVRVRRREGVWGLGFNWMLEGIEGMGEWALFPVTWCFTPCRGWGVISPFDTWHNASHLRDWFQLCSYQLKMEQLPAEWESHNSKRCWAASMESDRFHEVYVLEVRSVSCLDLFLVESHLKSWRCVWKRGIIWWLCYESQEIFSGWYYMTLYDGWCNQLKMYNVIVGQPAESMAI